MNIDTDKLEELFKEKFKTLRADSMGERDHVPHMELNELWLEYCDKHKIIMLHGEWLADTLNEGKMKGRVCIHNCQEMFHENVCPWLLVPKKFAEKCLILGGLP